MSTTTMFNKGNNSNSLTTSNNNSNNNGTSTNATATTTSSITTNNNSSSNAASTTDRIEWSRATILDFIEDYRRQRVLWDPNTKGYHIKQTKYEALKLLGLKYGAEIRSIRSKIKSLRSSFHREHGKVLNGRRKGLNYQPMWFAYDAIRFILDGEAGDSDEAEGNKNESTTTLAEPNNNNNNSFSAWCNSGAGGGTGDHKTNIDEELLEERKISSRDIEHFNNHFLALGLQARHPMAMIAAVEAAAAASVAQERRQHEQKYALKQEQQQQQNDSVAQLKLMELSTNTNVSSNNLNLTSSSSSSASTHNPVSKPFHHSTKPLSPLANNANVSTTKTSNTPPPPPPPSSTTTCSTESFNVLHGSRSLDENSAIAAIGNAAATAIPSLSITAVARTSEFDGSEYCNISADDVKTEIFESDSTELAMLESARTSTPVPLNYHKNATDLTMNRNNGSSNVRPANSGTGGSSRKRKAQQQMHSNVNQNEDAPSPSKLHQKQQQQHSNAIHSRQCDYLNNNNNNNNNADDVDDGGNVGGGDGGGAGYSTSFSQLQTTLINNSNSNNNPSSTNGDSKPTTSSNKNPIDEYGVFGEYVAITIRKLKTSKAKIVVKHLINNLLFEAEMGKYDQGISSCKEPPELYKM